MAKTKTKTKTKTTTPPVPLETFTWRVVRPDLSEETVTAHDCDTYNGVLTFSRIRPDDSPIILRALARDEWRALSLVETEVSTPA